MTLEEANRYMLQKLLEGHKSDGCTFAPYGNFSSCCRMHDMLRRFRPVIPREADRLLRECIMKKGHPVVAWLYWFFVRVSFRFYK